LGAKAILLALVAWQASSISAQQPANVVPAGQPPINAAVNDFGLGPVGAGNPGGDLAAGGAAAADFDSLIDLITSTVEADSWEENGTGEGQIQPFDINGVYVDASGALRLTESARGGSSLASIRDRGAHSRPTAASAPTGESNTDRARRRSAMRYVSLPRLEAAIAARQTQRRPLDPAMLTLGGLQRIQFVLVYPESGDVVLAGPAGDWDAVGQSGLVAADTGRPLVRLDDLLSLWRRQETERSAAFGCSIIPRQEALGRTQQFLAASAAQPIEPSQRRQWLAALRDTLGVQDVEYYNIDPNSRVASLLLAADYHMKLVGMGLAEAVPGVKSYLATVRLSPGGQAPPMSVLRWWFSMPTSRVESTAERDAFTLPDQCVEVLSENELLAARGQRVPTGASDELNSRFAKSFTANFAALSEKYPVYGQLERVFELALALALIEKEDLAARVGWTPTLLLNSERLRLPEAPAPRGVETVINHRIIGGRQIIAGISGGVWVDGLKSLAFADVRAEGAAKLANIRRPVPAPMTSAEREQGVQEIVWWWD
jgi:hypothetical protein